MHNQLHKPGVMPTHYEVPDGSYMRKLRLAEHIMPHCQVPRAVIALEFPVPRFCFSRQTMHPSLPAFLPIAPATALLTRPALTSRSSELAKRPRAAVPRSPSMSTLVLRCPKSHQSQSQTPSSPAPPHLVPMIQISRMPGFGAVEDLDLFLRNIGGGGGGGDAASGGAGRARRRGAVQPLVEYAAAELMDDGGESRKVVVHPAFDS
jgi:hypothetical protein